MGCHIPFLDGRRVKWVGQEFPADWHIDAAMKRIPVTVEYVFVYMRPGDILGYGHDLLTMNRYACHKGYDDDERPATGKNQEIGSRIGEA